MLQVRGIASLAGDINYAYDPRVIHHAVLCCCCVALMLCAWAHSECLCVGVWLCVQRLELPLCLCSLSWQGSVQLRDLAVDERTQRFLQLVVVPLQLPVVLLLILANQSLILPQGILTPGRQKQQGTHSRLGAAFFMSCEWVTECVITSWWSL